MCQQLPKCQLRSWHKYASGWYIGDGWGPLYKRATYVWCKQIVIRVWLISMCSSQQCIYGIQSSKGPIFHGSVSSNHGPYKIACSVAFDCSPNCEWWMWFASRYWNPLITSRRTHSLSNLELILSQNLCIYCFRKNFKIILNLYHICI